MQTVIIMPVCTAKMSTFIDQSDNQSNGTYGTLILNLIYPVLYFDYNSVCVSIVKAGLYILNSFVNVGN